MFILAHFTQHENRNIRCILVQKKIHIIQVGGNRVHIFLEAILTSKFAKLSYSSGNTKFINLP